MLVSARRRGGPVGVDVYEEIPRSGEDTPVVYLCMMRSCVTRPARDVVAIERTRFGTWWSKSYVALYGCVTVVLLRGTAPALYKQGALSR